MTDKITITREGRARSYIASSGTTGIRGPTPEAAAAALRAPGGRGEP